MNRRFLYIFLLVILSQSCEKDWNTPEGYAELYAVYGTFNLKDTAQYVRINRVYTTGDNPADYARAADSVHIDPALFKVTLQRWVEGEPTGPPIEMVPSRDFEKGPGAFTAEGYNQFKTTERLQIDSEYLLHVINTSSGYEMSARVSTFGRRTLHQSFLEMRYFNITQYKPERLDYSGSLMPDQFEKMIQRLLYLEITPTDTVEKILDWRPWLEFYGAYKDDSSAQFSDAYFQFIGESIPPDPAVKRIAVGVDKLLIVNSEELQLFIDLGASQGSLHYNPDYTNFDKGTGYLGFRYYYTFFAIALEAETRDSLALGRFTGTLNFADSQGQWH